MILVLAAVARSTNSAVDAENNEGAKIVVELDQFKYKIGNYEEPLSELKDSLGIEQKQERIDQLEAQMEAPDFWDDVTSSQFVMKELKQLKDVVESYQSLEEEKDDIQTMIEMGYEEGDEELIPEIKEMLEQFIDGFESLRIGTLLSGEYDKEDAILSLNAGAGGTESCDWVSMLYRMYYKWAEKKGFKVQVLDYLDGEVAGIKSVTMQISGENAYGYLKSEKGIHRLVRISPFNAAGKRQTSFASCDIMPDIKTDINIEIADDDIRIDTYRASGAGGQHINKTDSAIRITHLPTGTVVQCQNERSQRQNKEKAMQMLKAKLYLLKEQEKQAELSGIRGEVMDNGWGSQIRSYVLQPYTMVKDHRTGEESGNPSAVLDGALDSFMNAYLKWENLKQVSDQD
jgi:peptide chain release factor 2